MTDQYQAGSERLTQILKTGHLKVSACQTGIRSDHGASKEAASPFPNLRFDDPVNALKIGLGSRSAWLGHVDIIGSLRRFLKGQHDLILLG